VRARRRSPPKPQPRIDCSRASRTIAATLAVAGRGLLGQEAPGPNKRFRRLMIYPNHFLQLVDACATNVDH
jgi:hypothetical protein